MKLFTVEDYRDLVRELYTNEKQHALSKGYWLKLGLAIKQVIEDKEFLMMDEATDAFEKRIFKIMEESK